MTTATTTDYDQRKYDLGKIVLVNVNQRWLIDVGLVVFGATGFTGALTCEYLAEIQDKVRKEK